jgi:hypothetical protein
VTLNCIGHGTSTHKAPKRISVCMAFVVFFRARVQRPATAGWSTAATLTCWAPGAPVGCSGMHENRAEAGLARGDDVAAALG